MAKTTLYFCVLLCIKFSADCVRIQFYENADFTGPYHESKSTLKCNNFPGNKSPFVKSIKTDSCLMIYLDINCKSPYSWKIMPPEVSDAEYRLGSFHVCNEKEGGTQLNLDITEYFDIWNPIESPKILESYENVCSCVNVPKYIQLLDKWSVNNHGNELLGYFEPDCSDRKWKPKFLPAGHSLDSRKVYMHHMTDGRTSQRFGIQSFGPTKYSAYFQASCDSAGATQTAVNIPEVQLADPNLFDQDLKSGTVEFCKIDKHALKSMENRFLLQMEALSSLLKKFSELEKNMEMSVKNFKTCQQNSTEMQ